MKTTPLILSLLTILFTIKCSTQTENETVGFETAWMIGMWGAEIKYLANNKHSQFYFTPKVGLSAVGFASILYCYNVPSKDKLTEIGKHQISITVNWSKKLLSYFK